MKKFLKSIGKGILYLLFYFGIQFIVSFALGIAATVCMMLGGNNDLTSLESDLMGYTTIIVLVSNALSLLIIWFVFKIRKKRLLAEVQLHKCNIKHLVAVALLGLGFSNVWSWIIEIIPFPESLVESFTTSHAALSIGNPIINFISVVVLTPIVEEVFFRGLIYTRLKSGMPTVMAAIFSAVIFGVMHGEIIWMLYTFAVGLMLVWVFEKTKSLLACIVVHVVNNGLSQLTENTPQNSTAMEYIILIVSLIILVASTIYIIKTSNKEVTGQMNDSTLS